MRKFTFVKENTGRWYIVLPEWTGDKEELEMVMGADTMLDILSQGDSVVDVVLSTEPFDNHKFELMFINEESGGGWYNFESEFNAVLEDMKYLKQDKFNGDEIKVGEHFGREIEIFREKQREGEIFNGNLFKKILFFSKNFYFR